MMQKIKPLPIEQLYRKCDASAFDFSTTQEIDASDITLGQERAIEAINFALAVESEGFNIFAMGIPRSGKEKVIKSLIANTAMSQPAPDDWCYVYNFSHPDKPRALCFPPGQGHLFCTEMHQLFDDLRNTVPATFESSEYQVRRQIIEQKFQEQQSESITKIREQASQQEVDLITTPSGFTFSHRVNGETVTTEIFQSLPENQQKEIEEKIAVLQKALSIAARQFPLWQRELFREIKALDQQIALGTVENLILEIVNHYGEFDGVKRYLDEYKQDVIENIRDFLTVADNTPTNAPAQEINFTRYQVNRFAEQENPTGAPIVYLNNPSIENLLGRVEQQGQYGMITSDLTMIQPGALHHASGGYLIIEAEKILTKPFAWEALKRSLFSKQIKIDSLERSYGFVGSTLLEPEPIPLKVKVILLGNPSTYYLLSNHDNEFNELFRVIADFDDRFERSEENATHYAQLIANIAQEEKLLPFSNEAVANIIEYASRISGDSSKLSLNRDALRDLMIEANYQAGQNNQTIVDSEALLQGIESQKRRSERIKERYYEQIIEDTVLIDTSGEKVGQINGLAVLSLGDYGFGKPTRITARVRIGSGKILDIERQVELGGALHSKGVLILSNYLAAKYSKNRPLALSASLVFEQSYGGVDGDSASSTELYALLSALANAPIKQSIAVTGSVNQFGQIQAIGGVNEKIEGFFDICKARELTGHQAVIIPQANVKNLMLRKDVVQAAKDNLFAVYAVSSIDEGIALLTGIEAGVADEKGNYPHGTINFRVAEQLQNFARALKDFSSAEANT